MNPSVSTANQDGDVVLEGAATARVLSEPLMSRPSGCMRFDQLGADDPIFPPDIIGAASALVPHSRVVLLPMADHSSYLRTPVAWNDIVLRFLNGMSE